MNLLQVKQHIKVGMVLDLQSFRLINGEWEPIWNPGPREVSRVNTVGFALWTDKEGVRTESFADWPRASELTTITHPKHPEQLQFRTEKEGWNQRLVYTEVLESEVSA